MGMDLKPIAPSPDAPEDEFGVEWGRYNWTGWLWLHRALQNWGIDTTEFSGSNDGAVISDKTCKLVADEIERRLPELEGKYRDWLRPHVAKWRTCGGYEQW